MSIKPSSPLRFIQSMAVVLVMVLTLSACYEADTEETAAVANGVDANVGPVQVRSLLIVSSGESEPGRLLGTLSNTSDTPEQVTLADGNDEVAVTVPDGQDYGFDTRPAQFSTVAEIPGSRVPVTVSAGSESVELLVPVFDGTLEPYRPYVPSTPASGAAR
jgi:hypothetical protein